MNAHLAGALRTIPSFVGAVVMAFSTAAWAAPQLLVPYSGPRAKAIVEDFKSDGTAVRFNSEQMLALRPGDEVEFSLPSAMRHEYVFELATAHGDGIHSWVGRHKTHGNLYRAIVTTGPGGSFGVFSTPDGEFRLIPGGGHDWLVDMNAEQVHLPDIDLRNDMRFVPAGAKRQESSNLPSPFVAIPGVNTLSMAKIAPSPSYFVDLMFVYTQGLAAKLGTNLMTRLNFLVTRANTSYTDSEIAIQLRLVRAVPITYTDANDNGDALNEITPGCIGSFCGPGEPVYNVAVFGTVEVARTAAGADVVAFMRDGSSFGGSGLAWLGSNQPPNANFMYSITTGCVLGCESVFIHEVGHNMGNRHDRATSAWQAGGTTSYGQGAFTYSFGYYFCATPGLTCNPELPNGSAGACAAGTQPECAVGNGTGGAGTNNFSDIMAYFHGSTLNNYKFSSSSPTVTCAGPSPTPTACGVAGSADTALSMNNVRVAMSAIKAQVAVNPLPGSLQFTATAFTALQSAGNLTLTVSRVGGSNGAVQVSYATSNGTATAGSDYTTMNGTLNWANGDTANKNILVPITNDGVTEGNESFTVTLSNPAGAAGVFLGFPSVAAGVIAEPWPPGGVAPTGFTTASAPAWAVATDHSADGDGFSWKSGAISFSGGVPAPSTTQYTATFVAGTLSFSYKVDSYPGNGFFDFLLDGVPLATDSGDSGWKFFSTPITAGVHTLQWRYRPVLSFPCSNAIPEPPQGASCADRAWIDGVSLPMPPPPALPSTLTDLNGDHKSDLLYRNFTTGQIYRIFMNGFVQAGAAIAYVDPDTAWKVVADADFTGDGVTDLLWRNSTTGLVYLMPFSASGLPSAGAIIYTEPSAAWKIVHTPDFDGDGKADILWWNSTTGQVFGLRMNGTTVAAAGLIYSDPDTAWKIAAVGDFAGSGKKNQLLWRNSTTGQVYLMTVTLTGGVFGQTGAHIYQEADTSWKIIAAADFDGNGKTDILWRNDVTGQVYMMLMNGATVSSAALVYTEANLAWKIVSVGDYDGDGKADILYRNDITGQVFMIRKNGLATLGAAIVYNEPNTAWRLLGPWEYAQ